jgi:hypothetical protein
LLTGDPRLEIGQGRHPLVPWADTGARCNGDALFAAELWLDLNFG